MKYCFKNDEIDNYHSDFFLKSNFFFDFEDDFVRETIKNIVGNSSNKKEKAKKIFYFVRDEIKYTMFAGIFTEKDYRSSAVLRRGKGFCVQKAILLVSLLRGAGIPAAIGFADIKNHALSEDTKKILGSDVFPYHGFAFVNLGRWLKVTPTFDVDTCEKAGYPLIEFDGERDAVFPQYMENGKRFVTYLRYRGVCFKPPVDDMIKEWKKVYGKGNLKNLVLNFKKGDFNEWQ